MPVLQPNIPYAMRKEKNMLERGLEKFLFASRWLMAPLFIGLVLGLFALVVKTGQIVYETLYHAWFSSESRLILDILGLVDLTLTAALIVIVIFSGYENFVSRLDAKDHQDWPEWMATIDFSGLKLKLMSSIVAISGIQLLRAFMDVRNLPDRDLMWYVAIHLVFVVSGLALAVTDKISGHGPAAKEEGH